MEFYRKTGKRADRQTDRQTEVKADASVALRMFRTLNVVRDVARRWRRQTIEYRILNYDDTINARDILMT